MSKKRVAQVPSAFGIHVNASCSKADLVEIVWDLMMQSPWFDESSASDDPAAVAKKVVELREIVRRAVRV